MDEETEVLRPRSPVTFVLVAANLAVFFAIWRSNANPLLVDTQRLVEFGAVDMRAIWEGEIWRLVSGMFVHVGLWHLALNLLVLWQVGRLLEQVMGSARYLLVYLVSGVAGFSLSLLFHPALTAGASGAIFGVVGGLLALAAVSKDQPLSTFLYSAMIPVVAATLALGMILPFVDNSAHIGGLIFGYVLSYGLFADTVKERIEALRESGMMSGETGVSMQPRFGTGALVCALLAFAALVPLALRPTFSPRYQSIRGHVALERGESQAALQYLRAAEALSPNDPAVLSLRARYTAEQGETSEEQVALFYDVALRAYAIDFEDAFLQALTEAGGRGEETMLFRDPLFTAGYCNATLTLQGDQASSALLNNCAWLMSKSGMPGVRDVARALTLSKRAVARAQEEEGPEDVSSEALAAYLHTYAYALAEGGDPEEARAIMERIVAEKLSTSPLYVAERRRFAALAEDQQSAPREAFPARGALGSADNTAPANPAEHADADAAVATERASADAQVEIDAPTLDAGQ